MTLYRIRYPGAHAAIESGKSGFFDRGWGPRKSGYVGGMPLSGTAPAGGDFPTFPTFHGPTRYV